MQRRTVNRAPLSVSTSNGTFNSAQLFVQNEFSGLCDNKNDINVDQQSFSEVENMMIDRNNILVSRPPIKRHGATKNIIKSWKFGNYTLFVKKELYNNENVMVETTDGSAIQLGCKWRYTVQCDSHKMISVSDTRRFSVITYEVSATINNWTYEPTFFATPIEDKIFIWIAGNLFYCLNTVGVTSGGETRLFFEDARKYLYVPVTTVDVNGVSRTAESESVLTDAYTSRFLFSESMQINTEELAGENVDVSVATGEQTDLTTEQLYSVTIEDGSQYALIYPYSKLEKDCVYDVIETSVSVMYLRYNFTTGSIAYSFDAKVYTSVNYLDGVMGKPAFSKDGKYIFAFTKDGMHTMKIQADGGSDDNVLYQWELENWGGNGSFRLSQSLVPTGYMSSKDVYSCLVEVDDFEEDRAKEYKTLLFQKWYNGTEFTSFSSVVQKNGVNIANGRSVKIAHSLRTATTNAPIVCVAGDLASGEAIAIIDVVKTPNYIGTGITRTTSQKSNHGVSIGVLGNGFFRVAMVGIESSEEFSATDYVVDISYYGTSEVYTKFRVKERSPEEYRDDTYTAISDDGFISAFMTNVSVGGSSHIDVGNPQTELPDRELQNGDGFTVGGTRMPCIIHKVNYDGESSSSNGVTLTTGSIRYGDMIVVTEDVVGPDDYDFLSGENGMNRYIITDGSDTDRTDIVRIGDEVTLTPYGHTIKLPVGNHGNLTDSELTITSGNTSNTMTVTFERMYDKHPIGATKDGVLYSIYGNLWSSIPSETVLAIDKHYNLDSNRTPFISSLVPTHSASLSEYHFSVEDDKGHMIESSVTRRNKERDFLLYLPKSNEQKFADEITALHKISDDKLAVFSADSVWYISSIANNDGTLYYTIPVKSKMPIGCRKGSDVTTMQDGQTTLVPTARGIAAVSPQDFVATTEPNITYITEKVWQTYRGLYNDPVIRAALVTQNANGEFIYDEVAPMIKCRTYSYYVMFFKYLSDEILMLDTRTSSWWVERTQYPIRDILVTDRMYLVLQIDYTSFNYTQETEILALPKAIPDYGTVFVWADTESEILYSTKAGEKFKSLSEDVVKYQDYVMTKKSGATMYKALKAQPVNGKVTYADGKIDWFFSSQRLHFGAIDYYKSINSFIIDAKSVSGVPVSAEMSYKVFREKYHSVATKVKSFRVDDVRAYSMKVNVLHATFFQYRFSRDTTDQYYPIPARFDALSIKYFLKEMIRT